jgi:hypothetical protein
VGVGERATRPLEQRRIGLDAAADERTTGGVLVDGLRADHELGGGEAARARDPDVQDGGGRLDGKRLRGRGGRLDGANPAHEGRRSVRARELALRRCDHEDHG